MSLLHALKPACSHFVFVVSVAVLAVLVYFLQLERQVFRANADGEPLASHAMCLGSNHTERRCKFKNLCYKRDSDDFVFFLDEDSVKSGVPVDRFRPALAEVSSVIDHNRYFFNFVEVPSHAFAAMRQQYNIVFIEEDVIVFGRFKPDNLMHLLHDDVLPLISMARQLLTDVPRISVFFWDDWGDFFSYPLMRFAADIYQLIPAASLLTPGVVGDKELLCFRTAHVGVSRETTWYDYGFRAPQAALPVRGQEVSLRNTLNFMLRRLNLRDRQCDMQPVVLISRQNTRFILNERQLLQSLSSAIDSQVPVMTLRTEAFRNLSDLVWNVRCAKVLIGVHGSGLILSAFLPRDSAVIEIFPYAINANHYTPYKTLCQLLGFEYISWMNKKRENSVTHPDYPASLGGINHLPPSLIQEITQSSEVKRHLCCSDPEWLFRAYQDTIVDVESFSAVFSQTWLIVQSSQASTERMSSNRMTAAAAPAAVSSIACQRTGVEAEITWHRPWNLDLMALTESEQKTTKYEVVVEAKGRNEREAFVTKSLILKARLSGSQNLIWIRCFVNGLPGPFNLQPHRC